ncbi:hypothetical protein EJB05_11832, partial [Eragrostis curvula]
MAQPAVEVLPFTDDILAEILIHLPTLGDFGRACASCPAFRRVITAPSFLRRLRALHPPLLLGIHTGDAGFLPAEAPHPSAPAGRALAAAADFSLSFLPYPDRWRLRDFRDGLALLSAIPDEYYYNPGRHDGLVIIQDLAVCDPLHRRYLRLPSVPVDRADLIERREIMHFEPFLDPSGKDEGDTSFRVICLVYDKTKMSIFLFSSKKGRWCAVAFDGWKDLVAGSLNRCRGLVPELSPRCYAHGCVCWVMCRRNKLLMLDTQLMKFSDIDVPPASRRHTRAIVEAGEGRLGMFALHFHLGNGTYDLCYTVLPNDGLGTNHLHPEVIIPLPSNHSYTIIGAAGGFLLLAGRIEDQEEPNYDCFSLNLKTFQLERFCGGKNVVSLAHVLAGFPPSLSAPAI